MDTPETIYSVSGLTLDELNYGQNLVALAVYGSRANGNWTQASDIDLLIVLTNYSPTKSREYSLMPVLDECELAINTQINHRILNPAEFMRSHSLCFEIALNHFALIDKSSFLTTAKKIVIGLIKDKLILRKASKGLSYWVIEDEKTASIRLSAPC